MRKSIFLSIIFLVLVASETQDKPAEQNCEFSCATCEQYSPNLCTSCSHYTRGYDGKVAFGNSCNCLGSMNEVYKKSCSDTSSLYGQIVFEIVLIVLLWILGMASGVVAAFGNSFMGFYACETIQTIGYLQYSSAQSYPESMSVPFSLARYYSASWLPNILHGAFLETDPALVNSNSTNQIVYIENQMTQYPRLTFLEVPANFIYNGITPVLCLLGCMGTLKLITLSHRYWPSGKIKQCLEEIQNEKLAFKMRIFQFFNADILFFAVLQWSNIKFESFISISGIFLSILAMLLVFFTFSSIFYILNIQKVKFSEKANGVFFNKLRNNDKPNRNFFLIQQTNKASIVITLLVFMKNYEMQAVVIPIVQFLFSALTLWKIKLKKKRYFIFLCIVNLLKLLVFIFFAKFALEDNSIKVANGWIVQVTFATLISVMIVFICVEIFSQIPDIIYFIKKAIQFIFSSSFGSSQNAEIEMNQVSIFDSGFIPNPIYQCLEGPKEFKDLIDKQLNSLSFDLPEEPTQPTDTSILGNQNSIIINEGETHQHTKQQSPKGSDDEEVNFDMNEGELSD